MMTDKDALKQERARDAALAMQEYRAEQKAVLARTERLRALRLAKETRNASRKTAGDKHKTAR
jgi:hypothetical protein